MLLTSDTVSDFDQMTQSVVCASIDPNIPRRHCDSQTNPRERGCLRERVVVATVISLLIIHASILAHAATKHSPTGLEPAFLVAGLSHWEFGRFELFRVNPPLVRMVAALPVMAVGYEMDWSGFYDSPSGRPEFLMGADFIKVNGERSIWLFTIARWACIPFSLMGGLFCFLWSRELWKSEIAGLIALAFWCFDPNILAHGELITTDCAAASFGVGAGYFFWRWLNNPTWGRALALGLMLGLAELAKMTWMILFALWPILWLFWLLTSMFRNSVYHIKEQHNVRGEFLQLSFSLMLGIYVLNLGYGFDESFNQLKDFTFTSSTLTGREKPGIHDNRFADTWAAKFPVPLPRQYLRGFDLQKSDFESNGPPSYLAGEWKEEGWWYYYLYGLGVKTTHGLQIMMLLAIFTQFAIYWRSSEKSTATWRDQFVLLSPALLILVLVSSQLKFNHHVRYVLPVFGFAFIFIGCTAYWFRDTAERF